MLSSPTMRALLLALAAVALGGLLRWAVMDATFPVHPVGDELYYARVAGNIAAGEGHLFDSPDLRALRPPANSYLLSVVITDADGPTRYFPLPLRRVMRLQVVIGTLLIAASGVLAYTLFGARAAVIACAIAALYPTFVAFSHYFWSESLFALLVTLALSTAVLAEQRRSSLGLVLFAGALFGLSALTREVGLVIAGCCGLWWVAFAGPDGRVRALGRATLLVGSALLVVLPWTVRNYAELNHFVPISTIGWFTTAEGNLSVDSDPTVSYQKRRRSFINEYLQHPEEIARMQFARTRALEEIRSAGPLWFGKKLIRNLPPLLQPDSFLFYKLGMRAYGDVSLGSVRMLVLAHAVTYLGIVALAVMGASIVSRPAPRHLLLLILSAVVLLHVATLANSRYRVPLMPFVISFAAFALSHWRELPRRLAGRRRGFVAIVLFAFSLACIPGFSEDSYASRCWTHGVDALRQKPTPFKDVPTLTQFEN